MGMNIRSWLTNHELDQMSRYLSLVETSLAQQIEDLEAAYHKDMLEEITDHESFGLEDQYTDQFLEVGYDFPKFLCSSFVVAWYSFVEQELLDICDSLDLRITISPKDNIDFGKGIRRARRFLLKVGQYEIYSPHWQELVYIGQLRNLIVHKGTRVTGSYLPSEEGTIELQSENGIMYYFPISKSLFQYIQKHDLFVHSGIFLDIVLSFTYSHHLVEFGKELFGKLYADLYKAV